LLQADMSGADLPESKPRALESGRSIDTFYGAANLSMIHPKSGSWRP
jgi:hypothetical protein